jgi:hypothetical protein
MAKKQTRRSISVSRTTYERLKAFCETNHISMSQLVETRVNDFLGADVAALIAASAPVTPAVAPVAAAAPRPIVARPAMHSAPPVRPVEPRAVEPRAVAPAAVAPVSPVGHAAAVVPAASAAPAAVPMTSAAARFAVEPPPPIIKPRQDTAAPKPAEKRPEQIFTF